MHHMDSAFWTESEPALALAPVRTVAPVAQPVSLQEAKTQVKARYHDDDDADIQAYLDAAVDHLDGWSGILGRALINQTWRADFSQFGTIMRLPLAPLQSVTSVTYYDGDNAQQTLATSVYGVHTDSRGPFVELLYGQAWPTIYPRRDAVSVTFVVGYGATADSVPARLKAAIRLHVAHLYETRETEFEKQKYPTLTYERLVKPFVRVYS